VEVGRGSGKFEVEFHVSLSRQPVCLHLNQTSARWAWITCDLPVQDSSNSWVCIFLTQEVQVALMILGLVW
jgi:hypothetical protein